MHKGTLVRSCWLAGAAMVFACSSASADKFENSPNNPCQGLPTWRQLQSALSSAVSNTGNGGFGLNMWATIVANDGTVCAVTFSGSNYQGRWLESRVISAQKAYTANGLSLSNGAPPSTAATHGKGFSIATANLYSAVQPGGSLFGLQ